MAPETASPATAADAPALRRPRRGRRLARLVPASTAGFAALTTALVAAMYANIVSGAWVRLTGSGLGCPDWPLCHGRPVPPVSNHALIEFSNRLVALTGIALAVLTYVVARRAGAEATDRRLALFAALGTVGQAPLGALTVIFDLHPLLVMSHFLLAMVVLAAVSTLWARVHGERSAPTREAPPPWMRPLAFVTVGLGFLLLVSGAFSTAAGPHSGGQDIRRIGDLVTSTHRHVVVASLFAFAAAMLLLALWGRWRPPGSGRLAVALLVLLPLQALIGEWQWRSHLPWGMVLAHVAVAAAVWSTLVALATRIARA